jgi:hypothetical protein
VGGRWLLIAKARINVFILTTRVEVPSDIGVIMVKEFFEVPTAGLGGLR